MKFIKILSLSIVCIFLVEPVHASDTRLEEYVASFDYVARKEMKIDSKELIDLLKEDQAPGSCREGDRTH